MRRGDAGCTGQNRALAFGGVCDVAVSAYLPIHSQSPLGQGRRQQQLPMDPTPMGSTIYHDTRRKRLDFHPFLTRGSRLLVRWPSISSFLPSSWPIPIENPVVSPQPCDDAPSRPREPGVQLRIYRHLSRLHCCATALQTVYPKTGPC